MFNDRTGSDGRTRKGTPIDVVELRENARAGREALRNAVHQLPIRRGRDPLRRLKGLAGRIKQILTGTIG